MVQAGIEASGLMRSEAAILAGTCRNGPATGRLSRPQAWLFTGPDAVDPAQDTLFVRDMSIGEGNIDLVQVTIVPV